MQRISDSGISDIVQIIINIEYFNGACSEIEQLLSENKYCLLHSNHLQFSEIVTKAQRLIFKLVTFSRYQSKREKRRYNLS